MFYFDGTRWQPFESKVTYTETITEYENDITRFDGKDNLNVEPITLTPEQTKRLEAVTGEIPISDLIAFVMDDADVPGVEGYRKDSAIKGILFTLTDEQAEANATLILELAEEWQPDEAYERYAYIQHEGALYKTIHPIRPHDTLSPPDAPHLYTRVGAIENGEIAVEEWRQPTGEHDAYRIGDKVLHLGQMWVCTLGDAGGFNSWEPGVYGWEIVAT